MGGLTLDVGALIAVERQDVRMAALVRDAVSRGIPIAVPAGALGQVWRGGPRQARLARLIGSAAVEVVPLDETAARESGELCAAIGTTDVIDASVALCAVKRRHAIVTSDPFDLRRLAPRLELIVV